jgi:uncharacterized membrane protein HdeD (DUF308 family)
VPARPPRGPVAVLLLGVLVLFVGVIAQLAVTDGLAETLWVVVSIVGALLVVLGIVLLVRRADRQRPPED